MSYLNICGFDTGDASEAFSVTGTTSIQNTTTYSGIGYALRCNPTTTATGWCALGSLPTSGAQTNGTSVGAQSWFTVHFLYNTKPASGDEIIFRFRDGSGNQKLEVRLNSSGKLAAYDSTTTLITTGSTVLASGTWYALSSTCANGASASWEVRIGGVSEISGTNNLGTNGSGSVNLGKSLNRNGNTVDFYYDDFAWSNSAYPPDGIARLLKPNANGANQSWSIGAGSGSHYQQVNEIPPDGDTTYLLSPLVTNDLETEQLQTGTSQSVSGTINTVKSCADLKQNVTGGTARVVLVSGATTDTTSADFTAGSSYALIQKMYDTDPNTGAAWTQAAIDKPLETGGKNTSAVNQVRMTWTGAVVFYTPSVARERTLTGVGV